MTAKSSFASGQCKSLRASHAPAIGAWQSPLFDGASGDDGLSSSSVMQVGRAARGWDVSGAEVDFAGGVPNEEENDRGDKDFGQ